MSFNVLLRDSDMTAQQAWDRYKNSPKLIRATSILSECEMVKRILEHAKSEQSTERWQRVSANVEVTSLCHQEQVLAILESKVSTHPNLRELPLFLATQYLQGLVAFLDSHEENGVKFLERYLDPIQDREPILQEIL